MSSNFVVISEDGDDEVKGFLVPCKTSEFGEFLSGLLKTPKTIRHRMREPFVLQLYDVEDIILLLNQRIGEQQKYSNVSFAVSLFYSSGTSYVFGSLLEFLEHRDLSNSECSKLILSVVYLVDLPDSDVPQKQEIQLSFDAANDNDGRSFVYDVVDFNTMFHGIMIEIRHTHVTLGNDLCNILKVRADQLTRKSDFAKLMDSKWMAVLWLGSFATLGVGLASYGAKLVAKYMFRDATELVDILQSGSLTTSLVSTSFLTVIFIISSMVAGIVSLSELARKPKSMIITSSEHEAKLRSSDARYSRRWIVVTLSLLGTIGIGVISSLVATGVWSQLSG